MIYKESFYTVRSQFAVGGRSTNWTITNLFNVRINVMAVVGQVVPTPQLKMEQSVRRLETSADDRGFARSNPTRAAEGADGK